MARSKWGLLLLGILALSLSVSCSGVLDPARYIASGLYKVRPDPTAVPTAAPTAAPTEAPVETPSLAPTEQATARPTTPATAGQGKGGRGDARRQRTPTPEAANPVGAQEPAGTDWRLEPVNVERQVLLDQDGVRITATGFSHEGEWGEPQLGLLVENNSGRQLTIQVRATAVNDLMVGSGMYVELQPGKRAHTPLTFLIRPLEQAGITLIKKIEVSFLITPTGVSETYLISDMIEVPTDADPDYVQPLDDAGEVVWDDQGVRMVLRGVDSENSDWGTDVLFYLENTGDRDLLLHVAEVYVNDCKLGPYFSEVVMVGKGRYSALMLEREELQANGITRIDSLEFTFLAVDPDSWEELFQSDTIRITF
ncbi:MAG: hypothetical protein ACOX2L_01070 [Anaerolineae bacterium]|jgi:hypothetical protein|nr:hypothetical protein [Chloroflexota bacterium]